MHHRSRDASGVGGINGFAGEYSPFHYEDDVEDSDEDEGTEAGGFAGTCKTTLIDWIQLVQMGRRDAVLAVSTHDGKQGTLWCRDGDIIDADCDGIVGEGAVYRALSWKSGRVSVDFDAAVTRRRQIETATAGLLLRAAYRRDSGIHELASLGADTGADEASPFDVSGDPTEVTPPEAFLAFDQKPHDAGVDVDAGVGATSRGGLSLRFVLAGGLTVVLLFLAVAWRWMYPPVDGAPITETPGPVPVAPQPIAATRHAQRTPYAVRSNPPLPDAPAAIPQPATSKATPMQTSASKSAPARHRGTIVVARRSAATSATVQSQSPRPFEAPRAPLPAKARVDIINEPVEPTQPRVQIIREPERRVQPRIQIIEDRKPHIDTVE
jgi:hypothetical protein